VKDTTYILIPGLGDQKPIFGWFYRMVAKRWTRSGLPTKVATPKWGIGDPYESKLAAIVAVIAQEKSAGKEVALVGISAGAALGLLAFCRDRGAKCFISVAGFMQLSASDRQNKTFMKLTWYRAANQAEQEATQLEPDRRQRMMSLYGKADDVIEPARQRIAGGTNVQMHSRGHLL